MSMGGVPDFSGRLWLRVVTSSTSFYLGLTLFDIHYRILFVAARRLEVGNEEEHKMVPEQQQTLPAHANAGTRSDAPGGRPYLSQLQSSDINQTRKKRRGHHSTRLPIYTRRLREEDQRPHLHHDRRNTRRLPFS